MRITTLVAAVALAIVSALPAGAEDALETENVGTFSYLAGVTSTPMDAEELAGTHGTLVIWVTVSHFDDHKHMRMPESLTFAQTGLGEVTVGCGMPMAGMAVQC